MLLSVIQQTKYAPGNVKQNCTGYHHLQLSSVSEGTCMYAAGSPRLSVVRKILYFSQESSAVDNNNKTVSKLFRSFVRGLRTVGRFVKQVQIIVATRNKTYCRHVTSAYTAVCHGQQTA